MPTPTKGYRLKNGEKVPGVTTILGRFKESGGLIQWAFQQGQACERGEIRSLYDKRDEAASSGTLAHLLVESYINNEPQPDLSKYPTEIATAALRGFDNYRRWQEDNKIEIVEQEMQLVSEKHKYGGTPDAIGLNSRGQRVLIDWKTSSGVYVDYLIQCASYKLLYEENYPDKLIDGGVHLLRFSKETADFAHHFWQDLTDAEHQFLLLREAYDIDKILKKRV